MSHSRDNNPKAVHPIIKKWHAANVGENKLQDIDLLAATLDKFVKRSTVMQEKPDLIAPFSNLLLNYLNNKEEQNKELPEKFLEELRKLKLTSKQINEIIPEGLQFVQNEYKIHLEAVREMRKIVKQDSPIVPTQDIILYAELGANYGFHKAVLKTAQTLTESKHKCTIVYEDNSDYFSVFPAMGQFLSEGSEKLRDKDKYIEAGFSIVRGEGNSYKLCWGTPSLKGVIKNEIDLSAKVGLDSSPQEKLRQEAVKLLNENFDLLVGKPPGLELAAKMLDPENDTTDQAEREKAEKVIATMNTLISFAHTKDNYPEEFVGFGENAFDMISKKDKEAKQAVDEAGVKWISKTDWERMIKKDSNLAKDKTVILPSSEQMGDYCSQEKILNQSASRQAMFKDASLIYLQPLCWHGGRVIITPGKPFLDMDLCFTALGAIPKNPTPELKEAKKTDLDMAIETFPGTVVNVYGIHQVNQPPDSVEQVLLNMKTALEQENKGPVVFIDTTPMKLVNQKVLQSLEIEYTSCNPSDLQSVLGKESEKKTSCTFVKMNGYLPQSCLDTMLRKSPIGIFSGANSMESLLSLGNKNIVPIHAGGMDMPDTWELDSKAITELSHSISRVDIPAYKKNLKDDETLTSRKEKFADSLKPSPEVVSQLVKVIREEKCDLVEYQGRLLKSIDNPLNNQLSVCMQIAQRHKLALDEKKELTTEVPASSPLPSSQQTSRSTAINPKKRVPGLFPTESKALKGFPSHLAEVMNKNDHCQWSGKTLTLTFYGDKEDVGVVNNEFKANKKFFSDNNMILKLASKSSQASGGELREKLIITIEASNPEAARALIEFNKKSNAASFPNKGLSDRK